MSRSTKKCMFRCGPSRVYTRKPKSQCEAETGLTSRIRVFHGGRGSHSGKPAWAHGIIPFPQKVFDQDGNIVSYRAPTLDAGGHDRDQIAAEIGKITKARKRQKTCVRRP